MTAGDARPTKEFWTLPNIVQVVLLVTTIVGAGFSGALYAGKAAFSLYDLQTEQAAEHRDMVQGFADVTKRLDKMDVERAARREYTDRRFAWIGDRVSRLEDRQHIMPPPPPELHFFP